MGFLYQWLWVRILHGVPDSKPFEFETFKTTNIGMDLVPHKEIHMLQFILCLFGLHGATEIDYTVDNEEIKVCRDCMKEV